jgi:hypothetical protein
MAEAINLHLAGLHDKAKRSSLPHPSQFSSLGKYGMSAMHELSTTIMHHLPFF